jgi:aspartate/methionine/tyrosine aminotransferase
MFSARTSWDRTANALAGALAARRRAGRIVLDLTETNPTRVGLPYPPGLLDVLADPAGLDYEPAPAGLEAARAAVCAEMARHGARLAPDRIVLTASTSEAYAFAFKVLCEPGDDVLVPRPSYPLFEYLAGLESVRAVPYDLRWDGEWHLAESALRAALTARTRAVVVVHPNNPTGSFLKEDEAGVVVAFAAAAGLAVVSDEVFADYAFGPDPRRAATLALDGPALAFTLGGLSKSCGLPQLKLGWMAVTGPPALAREALARLEIVADTYLSVATPVQRALPRLLARRPALHAAIAERVRLNLDALRRAMDGSAASLLPPEGGWSAVLRVPATLPEDERVTRLLDDGVLVHPGFFFDLPSDGYLVLSLLPGPEVFADGVRRLRAHVDREAPGVR